MSYVEKKYRHILEDVLTKLTGGVNEEYIFKENTLAYELKVFPVKNIVFVTGILEGQSYVFTQGSDYELQDKTTLKWIGKKPDDGTTFYIDYYPETVTSPITDRNIGSVARTITEAFSLELAKLHAQLKYVYLNAFIDTATGESLDLLVSILSIERFKAGYAVGEVTFSRNTPAPADITIPVGTIITDKNESPYEYQITQEKVLREGDTSIDIPIKALNPGEGVNAETLTLMPKPVLGIEKVSNIEATSIGVQDETDEELRARAKKVVKGTAAATLESLQLSLMGLDFVKSVNIVDQPKGVAGRVDIIIDTEQPFKEVQAKVMEIVNKVKAAGVYVKVGSTTKIFPEYKLKLIPLEQTYTNEEIEAIKTDINKKVMAYFDSLEPGKNVLANKIISLAMGNEKVQTVEIIAVKVTKEGVAGEIPTKVLLNKDVYVDSFEKVAEKAVVFEPIEVPEEVTPQGEIKEVYPILADLLIQAKITEMDEFRLKSVLTSKAMVFFSDLATGEKIIFGSLKEELEDAKNRYTIEKDSSLQLIHTLDGLTVTLSQDYQEDEIRKDEVVELGNVEIKIIGG